MSHAQEILQIPSSFQGWPRPENTGHIYIINLECSVPYIGQTGRSTMTRIKEYHRHIGLYQPEKSAVAQTCDILLKYMTPLSWPENLGAWTASSENPLRQKCILTTWAGKTASSWLKHEILSFAFSRRRCKLSRRMGHPIITSKASLYRGFLRFFV